MTSSIVPTGPAKRIVRFDVVERTAHWLNAALFTVLIATAIPLYFGSFFGLVLPRFTVEQVHLWTGIALPVPLVIAVLGRWGRSMRRDLRRINYWTRGEIDWLKSFGRTRLEADKFNPGQKLNTIFVGASILILLGSGVILKWFTYFPVSWREGSTLVHDAFSFAIVAVIVGHIIMALTHRGSMTAMVRGWVSERWAAAHAAGWWHEVNATAASDEARP